MARSSRGRSASAARDELLADYPPAVAELTLRLRDAVFSVMPEAAERIYPGWRGIGFHHPTAGYVCGLFPHEGGVRVGFERGRLLFDPDRVLEGAGSRVRYLPVAQLDAATAAVLESLLRQAIAAT